MTNGRAVEIAGTLLAWAVIVLLILLTVIAIVLASYAIVWLLT